MKFIYLSIAIIMLPLSAQAQQVSKKDWMNAMSTALPTAFCNSHQYFRQCFKVSAEECEETAISATRVCLNKNEKAIPNTLSQPKDGSHWGRVVGSCAGEAYEIALLKKRINNEKCNDVNNWR